MAKTPFEHVESLLRQPAEFPFDGHVVEIFPEEVSVRLVGSDTIKQRVIVPDHINVADITKGMPVKLASYQDQSVLVAILPQLQSDLNYAGKGTVFPDPPQISVVITSDGWLVSWAAVPGADRYRVYRNDTPDETSVDEVGYTPETSIVVPYESPFIYFAVRSVSGLNESELSGWTTDTLPPEVPDTFTAINAVEGHKLTISGGDVAFLDPGFKCFEIQQADDGIGTGAVSLGNFFAIDFPSLQPFGPGTVKWYRIRSVDFAGNASDWTAWDEAVSGVEEIQDKFDQYGGDSISNLESLYWLKIADMDTDEVLGTDWLSTNGSLGSEISNYVEGDRGIKAVADSIFLVDARFLRAMDLSNEGRFGNGDYVVMPVYTSATAAGYKLEIYFDEDGNGTDVFQYIINDPPAGWNYIAVKKSDFSVAAGSPSWANITVIFVLFRASTNDYMILDDWRIVKADPDDATTYNDTGKSWDKATDTGSDVGAWHVYPGNRTGEPSKPYSYGQIKTATTPAVWYLSHKPLVSTDIKAGVIEAGLYLKEDDGRGGLAFYIQNVTAGAWDMYAIEADSSADTITLVKWVAGTRTVIASASFTFAPDQILWLGADFNEYEADAGRLKVYASLTEGNLIQAANLVLSEQDTAFLSNATGSVGVLSYQANIRFVDFRAGSPAHAEVADVAFSLKGPVLGPLVFEPGGELTIAGGVVHATHSHHTVDTESDAASDDLDTINGGQDGMPLILQAADSARTVVCKDGTGNLKLAGDCSLDNVEDTLTLFCMGSTWYELCRSNNGS